MDCHLENQMAFPHLGFHSANRWDLQKANQRDSHLVNQKDFLMERLMGFHSENH